MEMNIVHTQQQEFLLPEQLQPRNQKNVDSQESPLLKLPPEIRNMIWELLLVSNKDDNEVECKLRYPSGNVLAPLYQEQESRRPNTLHLNILVTCRAISAEASPILYRRNKVVFRPQEYFDHLAERLNGRHYDWLQRVAICQYGHATMTPRELARDLFGFLGVTVLLRQLKLVQFEVYYTVPIPLHTVSDWVAAGRRSGIYDNWEEAFFVIVGDAFSEWHQGLKFSRQMALVYHDEPEPLLGHDYVEDICDAIKTGYLTWTRSVEHSAATAIAAGPAPGLGSNAPASDSQESTLAKNQSRAWPNINYRNVNWDYEVAKWERFIYHRLPPVSNLEHADQFPTQWPDHVTDAANLGTY